MSNPNDKKAIDLGTESAERLFNPPKPREEPPTTTPTPLVLAIGDSWFNYWPRGDILDVLEDRLGYDVERNAKAGRAMWEMLYTTREKAKDGGEPADGPSITWLTGRLKSLNPTDRARLRAILISAGGNDVAGDADTLELMVNEYQPGQPLLNNDGVRQVVDGTLRGHVVTMLSCINHACEKAGLSSVPILLHGYSYPVPDGRGVLRDSWLKGPLVKLGYEELNGRKEVMKLLIDRLNNMQQAAIDDNKPAFSNVIHLDVRDALKSDARYQLSWQNELHPTIPVGFGAVAKCFIEALSAAPAPRGVERAGDATASPSPRTPRQPPRAKPALVSHSHDLA
jgi:hypothetical protein